jgi:hypothetical protein
MWIADCGFLQILSNQSFAKNPQSAIHIPKSIVDCYFLSLHIILKCYFKNLCNDELSKNGI